jgi:DNA-binding MarR family transcriptional regulator
MNCQQALQHVNDVPQSARTVLCTLADEGPLTMKDLQAASGLARRTVYAAIAKLREIGMIADKPSLKDTRQTWFWVPG